MPKKVSELAAATGLSRDYVRDAIRRGELPGYVVGSRYVIPDEAFQLFLRGQWKRDADVGNDEQPHTPRSFIRSFAKAG